MGIKIKDKDKAYRERMRRKVMNLVEEFLKHVKEMSDVEWENFTKSLLNEIPVEASPKVTATQNMAYNYIVESVESIQPELWGKLYRFLDNHGKIHHDGGVPVTTFDDIAEALAKLNLKPIERDRILKLIAPDKKQILNYLNTIQDKLKKTDWEKLWAMFPDTVKKQIAPDPKKPETNKERVRILVDNDFGGDQKLMVDVINYLEAHHRDLMPHDEDGGGSRWTNIYWWILTFGLVLTSTFLVCTCRAYKNSNKKLAEKDKFYEKATHDAVQAAADITKKHDAELAERILRNITCRTTAEVLSSDSRGLVMVKLHNAQGQLPEGDNHYLMRGLGPRPLDDDWKTALRNADVTDIDNWRVYSMAANSVRGVENYLNYFAHTENMYTKIKNRVEFYKERMARLAEAEIKRNAPTRNIRLLKKASKELGMAYMGPSNCKPIIGETEVIKPLRNRHSVIAESKLTLFDVPNNMIDVSIDSSRLDPELSNISSVQDDNDIVLSTAGRKLTADPHRVGIVNMIEGMSEPKDEEQLDADEPSLMGEVSEYGIPVQALLEEAMFLNEQTGEIHFVPFSQYENVPADETIGYKYIGVYQWLEEITFEVQDSDDEPDPTPTPVPVPVPDPEPQPEPAPSKGWWTTIKNAITWSLSEVGAATVLDAALNIGKATVSLPAWVAGIIMKLAGDVTGEVDKYRQMGRHIDKEDIRHDSSLRRLSTIDDLEHAHIIELPEGVLTMDDIAAVILATLDDEDCNFAHHHIFLGRTETGSDEIKQMVLLKDVAKHNKTIPTYGWNKAIVVCCNRDHTVEEPVLLSRETRQHKVESQAIDYTIIELMRKATGLTDNFPDDMLVRDIIDKCTGHEALELFNTHRLRFEELSFIHGVAFDDAGRLAYMYADFPSMNNRNDIDGSWISTFALISYLKLYHGIPGKDKLFADVWCDGKHVSHTHLHTLDDFATWWMSIKYDHDKNDIASGQRVAFFWDNLD